MWLEGVVTLFVLTRFAGHCPAFAEKYWQIYEYIGSHPEAQKIYSTVETNFPIEKQIEMIESCASCQVWGQPVVPRRNSPFRFLSGTHYAIQCGEFCCSNSTG